MITRFEQILGYITLVTLGTTVILSHTVTLSAANYLAVNFHINHYGLGAMCYLCALPLAMGKRTRLTYFVCLFPYVLYWIATFRFVAVNGLASTTPALMTVLLIALLYGLILDIILWFRRGTHGSQHTATG